MKKIFVIDTNVLMHDPESILKFEDNDIVIPISVIEELDELKKGQGEIPHSARHALKLIDSIRGSDGGEHHNFAKGVAIPNSRGGTLRIETEERSKLPIKDSPDNRIISVAENLASISGTAPVAVVSKDTVSPQLHDLYKLAFSTKYRYCQKMLVL